MRFKMLCCEVLKPEAEAVTARSPHHVEIEVLSKWLHDMGAGPMSQKIQAAVDAATDCDAVLLFYGLCNNGTVGVVARSVPVVIPRAHDCITLFLGSRKRYAEYFEANPGTYFLTSGWLTYDRDQEMEQQDIMARLGMSESYEEMVEKYGEENAQYLYETMVAARLAHYNQYTYIEMGIEPDDRFEREAREQAAERGWTFDKVKGDLSLLQRLVNGDWDPVDFLILAPGETVAASYDEGIVKAAKSA